MRIIAGKARNLDLTVPEGIAVRPTSGRGRKALLDSLGDLTDLCVLDLFSGSGAFALECASRGAARAVMVELAPRHAETIRQNCERVRKTGVKTELAVLQCDVLAVERYAGERPDLIFADPPYAESARLFRELTSAELFRSSFAGALLVWEIPDTPGARGEFMQCEGCEEGTLRSLGGVWFFMGKVCVP